MNDEESDIHQAMRLLREAGCECAKNAAIITLPGGQKVGLAPGIELASHETIGVLGVRYIAACKGCDREIRFTRGVAS